MATQRLTAMPAYRLDLANRGLRHSAK